MVSWFPQNTEPVGRRLVLKPRPSLSLPGQSLLHPIVTASALRVLLLTSPTSASRKLFLFSLTDSQGGPFGFIFRQISQNKPGYPK